MIEKNIKIKKQESLHVINKHSHLIEEGEKSISVDAINEAIKSVDPEQLQKIKDKTKELCAKELFSPEAERKRLGVLKYHMKKRQERLDSLHTQYEKDFKSTIDLLELSIQHAFEKFQEVDDSKKAEILENSNTMKDKKYLEGADYTALKTFFAILTDQVVQKNDMVHLLRKEIQDTIAHYSKEVKKINAKHIEEMKKTPFLDLETPNLKDKEIQFKTHQIFVDKKHQVELRLEEIQLINQELLTFMKKLWDGSMPDWKTVRYQAEQERFTKFVDKYISHSYIQEYFIKCNKDFEQLFVDQQEWMRKIVYAESGFLFSSECHRQLCNEATKLFNRNKEILEQSKKMMMRCELDLNEEKEILVEKFSMSMTECGVKSHYQVQAYLDDYFSSMCGPLFTKLKKNYDDGQIIVQNNHEFMTQILFLLSRILQEEMGVKDEMENMLDKGTAVYDQIQEALEHIRSSINMDMNELTDKIAKANSKRAADGVMHEFANLVHTFEEDTKNLRDQCLKMVQAQTSVLTEILDGFHNRMCQVLDIQVGKGEKIQQHNGGGLPRSNSKGLPTDSIGSSESAGNKKEKYSTKCLPPLTYEHSPLDTSLMTLIHFLDSKLDKGHHQVRATAPVASHQVKGHGGKKGLKNRHGSDEAIAETRDPDYIQALLIPPDTLDQVKKSLQRTVIQLFETIYVGYDLRLHTWKINGLQKVEGWMSDLGVFVKNLQVQIESLYRKALYDIEEIEAFKSKQIQATINKLNLQIQHSQHNIGFLTDRYRGQMKDIQETLGQKISKALRQERGCLRELVVSKVSGFQGEVENAFQELIRGFDDFDYSQVNEATLKIVEKSKKSVQERLRWFLTEIEGIKEGLMVDVARRIDYLEFCSEISGQERTLRLVLQSTGLKHESSFKALHTQLQDIQKMKTKEVTWDSMLEMMQNMSKFLKQTNDHAIYFGATDQICKRTIVTFNEYVNNTSKSNNNNGNNGSKPAANNSSNTNGGTMFTGGNKKKETFMSSQESIIKKTQEKIYEKSLEYYKQKYQAKSAEGLPSVHSDFWTQIEARTNEMKSEVHAKRQNIILDLGKIVEAAHQDIVKMQDWMLNKLDRQACENITKIYKTHASTYQNNVKKEWEIKKEENYRLISSRIENFGNDFQVALEKTYEQILNDFGKQMDYLSAMYLILLEMCNCSVPISKEKETNNHGNGSGGSRRQDQQQSSQTPQTLTSTSQIFKVKLNNGTPQTVAMFKILDDKVKNLLIVADHYIAQENRIVSSLTN